MFTQDESWKLLLERAFSHRLETGGWRRVYLREQEEVRKRMLIHAAPSTWACLCENASV